MGIASGKIARWLSLVEHLGLRRWSEAPLGAAGKGRPAGRAEGRGLGRQAQVAEKPAHAVRVVDEGNELHALNQTLSLYLLDTLEMLDQQSESYALDVLSLVEAILENPDVVLRSQLDRIKTERMDAMKAAGMDYEQRIAELETLEWPKPNREFIYATFNAFSDKHPWVGEENIRPKSVAREMFETFCTFADRCATCPRPSCAVASAPCFKTSCATSSRSPRTSAAVGSPRSTTGRASSAPPPPVAPTPSSSGCRVATRPCWAATSRRARSCRSGSGRRSPPHACSWAVSDTKGP